MIASEAIVQKEQLERSSSQILFGSLYQSQRAELPSFGTFVSQGAAVGALFAFLLPLIGMLSHPENGYNFLLIGFLPRCLFVGALFGLGEATTIWTATILFGRRIHPIIRGLLGAVILLAFVSTYSYLFLEPSPHHSEDSTRDYWLLVGLYAGCGAVLGLVIGSRFRPVSELIRGTETEQCPVVNALTGLTLRLIVIFGLMVSILLLIVETQGDPRQSELLMSVIAVIHFALAVLILFVRVPFSMLLPLALIIDFPIAAWMTDVLQPDQFYERLITLIYLTLWGGFLIFRATVPHELLSWLKRELRYYFID